jgi:hypothetical protein
MTTNHTTRSAQADTITVFLRKSLLVASSGFLLGAMLLTPQIAQGALPASCLDIATAHPGAPDGTYWIFPNNQAFQVYCKGMATSTAAEYLALVNTGGNFNFSQYTAGGTSHGTNVKTNYTKVRLDPATLLVDISDQTFSTSTGSLAQGSNPVSSMPYGVAMACGGSNGVGNIDLTSTPFNVTDTFDVGGFQAGGSATFSSNGQVVALSGNGNCGWIASDPAPFNPFNNAGTFQLNLGYLINIAPIDIKPDSDPASINPRSNGVIPVAILSTATFDARQVDPTKVTFGPTGLEAKPVHSAIEDVNGDGLPDMILQFETQHTGIVCGQNFALMYIVTLSDQRFLGFDSITTVRCKYGAGISAAIPGCQVN